MIRSALILAAFSTLLTACEQTPKADSIAAGKALFDENCAVCHGPGGNVRQAEQYDANTPNLREIAKRSAGGRLPRATLTKVIDGRELVSGHGRSMPLWGEVFSADGQSSEESISALLDYIESIQVR